MTETVFDSSAVLAALQNESGADVVERSMDDAVISTVNLAEVMTKLVVGGLTREAARRAFDGLGIAVVDFTRDLAEDAGELVTHTRRFGLSLGDRACLALARREKLPVLTADRTWRDVEVGVRIELIR